MSKKKKYCPFCQNKQRIIEQLEEQLRNVEMQSIAVGQINKLSS